MKRLTALLMTVSLMALMALPAFAQGSEEPFQIGLEEQNNSGISGGAELKDQGDGTTEVTLVVQGVTEKGEYPAHIHAGRCPEVGDITYPLEPVAFDANASAGPSTATGVSVTVLDAPIEEILAQQSAVNVHLHTDPSAYVACGDLPMAGELERLDEPETVTNTFELTLNGEVPPDQLFTVLYTPVHNGAAVGGTEEVVFCGMPDPQPDEVVVSDEDCVGGGNTYTYSGKVTVAASLGGIPAGTVLQAQWYRFDLSTGEKEVIHEIEAPLETGMTYTAEYTFGGGAGGDGKDATQGNQQAETPEKTPETGAGGLAPGTSIPVGNAAAGLAVLVGAGYAVVRRR